MSYPDPTLNTTYTYDTGAFGKGRLTGIARHGETLAYTYDRFGRLLQDGTLTYTWDKNGNRTSITYPEAITATYDHDFADRETTLEVQVGADPPLQLIHGATYEPLGPLKTLDLGNGLTETRAFDDRYAPAEIRVDGTSPVLDWDYTTATSSSTLTYLTTDHLGTPILATADTGALVWQGGFEPFGENWNGASGAGVFLRFPGQWVDQAWESGRLESGLYYNVHRWYGPEAGRYGQADPLASASADDSRYMLKSPDHLYGYANARPLFLIDRLGLEVEVCQRPNAIPQFEGTPLHDWPHQWIRTPQREAGAGPAGGRRPEDEQGCPVCRSMEIRDHSSEPVKTCRVVTLVDEECVNRLLEIGKPIGGFFPFLNDCGSFVDRVIAECRKNPGRPGYRQSPL